MFLLKMLSAQEEWIQKCSRFVEDHISNVV